MSVEGRLAHLPYFDRSTDPHSFESVVLDRITEDRVVTREDTTIVVNQNSSARERVGGPSPIHLRSALSL